MTLADQIREIITTKLTATFSNPPRNLRPKDLGFSVCGIDQATEAIVKIVDEQPVVVNDYQVLVPMSFYKRCERTDELDEELARLKEEQKNSPFRLAVKENIRLRSALQEIQEVIAQPLDRISVLTKEDYTEVRGKVLDIARRALKEGE